MLKKTLFAAAATIAVVASSSLPAAALTCEPGEVPNDFGDQCVPAPTSIPEPSSILGLFALGGFLGKKALDAQKVGK